MTDSVVVTGVGVAGRGGIGPAWQALGSSTPLIERLVPSQAPGFPEIAGGLAFDADPSEFLADRKHLKYMNCTTRLAVAAAGRALRDARLLGDRDALEKAALLLTVGPIAFDLRSLTGAIQVSRANSGSLDWSSVGSTGLRACSPMLTFHTLLNMPIGLVSMVFGLRGHNGAFYPDIGQAGRCLEAAVRGIRRGRFDRALVGGSAELFNVFALLEPMRLGRLASSVAAAQPFTEAHRGHAPAGGAAMVVLESVEHAARRGARCYAEVTDVVGPCDPGVAPPAHGDGDLVLATGMLDRRADESTLAWVGRRYPKLKRRVQSLDGIVGFLGPAALPFALACGAAALHDGELLAEQRELPLPEHAAVVAVDTEGRHTEVRLARGRVRA